MRRISIILAYLTMITFVVAGCQKKVEYKRDYNYSGVDFVKNKDLTFDKLSALVPMGKDISSIKQLENFIKDNIDEYTITKTTDSGKQNISLKNTVSSIRIVGESFFIKTEESTAEYRYESENNSYTVLDSLGEKLVLFEFTFRSGVFSYQIELTDGFSIRYNFK